MAKTIHVKDTEPVEPVALVYDTTNSVNLNKQTLDVDACVDTPILKTSNGLFTVIGSTVKRVFNKPGSCDVNSSGGCRCISRARRD